MIQLEHSEITEKKMNVQSIKYILRIVKRRNINKIFPTQK